MMGDLRGERGMHRFKTKRSSKLVGILRHGQSRMTEGSIII